VKRLLALAAVLALAVCAVAAAQPSAKRVNGSQLQKKFRAATSERIVVNKLRSSPGHYVAYEIPSQSFASKARWGTFTVYVVTAADPEADVMRLLADTRTGELGTPSGGIYWEQGATIHGNVFWMAKRRYQSNVVVTWVGSKSVRKTDATWTRLHKAVTAATK
jgi:hypothetical protein